MLKRSGMKRGSLHWQDALGQVKIEGHLRGVYTVAPSFPLLLSSSEKAFEELKILSSRRPSPKKQAYGERVSA